MKGFRMKCGMELTKKKKKIKTEEERHGPTTCITALAGFFSSSFQRLFTVNSGSTGNRVGNEIYTSPQYIVVFIAFMGQMNINQAIRLMPAEI